MIGDGRELNGIQQTLQFDGATGAWTLSEPTPDGPKTPERADILALLKASETPLSPTQVAKALSKNVSTVNNLLPKMVRDGDIKLARYGKYIPVETIESVESLHFIREKKGTTTLFDTEEDGSVPIHTSTDSTDSTDSTGVSASDPEAAAQESEASLPVAPPRLSAHLASTVAGAPDDAPRVPPPRLSANRRPVETLRKKEQRSQQRSARQHGGWRYGQNAAPRQSKPD